MAKFVQADHIPQFGRAETLFIKFGEDMVQPTYTTIAVFNNLGG